jgi:lipid-A-disaccharide synthase
MVAQQNKTYRIFLSAAEPSGDMHCAGLINAIKQKGYDIQFVGVGGEKMQTAGCEILETTVANAAMTYKAFGQVFHYYKLIKRIAAYFKNNKVDMVIVCDSPAFNFHIAKAAKKAGIKTLFYVAPQLWAWAPWRIKKLRKSCDKLCCILPFEQEWFSRHGIDAVFVGNPMLDEFNGDLAAYKKDYSNFEPKNIRVALLPGSRPAEIESLWQPMQRIGIQIKRRYLCAEFIAVAVDTGKKEALKSMPVMGFRCNYSIGPVAETVRNCDLAIVASGSVTLQVAAAGCPMVVMYQTSKTLWNLVGRWLIRTKYLSLVNILAQKELVPEFMPYFSSIDPIVWAIEMLLSDRDKLTQLSSDLIELVQPLAQTRAAEKTAQIALDMLPD